MRSRFYSWKNTFIKLGFDRKRPNKRGQRSHLTRPLRMELLEDRRMLATLTVNTEADTMLFDPDSVLSLREAILVVNSGIPTGLDPTEQLQISGPLGSNDTIIFQSSLSGGTIALSDAFGELPITSDLMIDASGLSSSLTINAGNGPDTMFGTGDGYRIINIDGGVSVIDVTLKGLTLKGGDVDVNNSGGAILAVSTNLTIQDSIITGNYAFLSGGGISAQLSGSSSLVVKDSEISGNTAYFFDGGGISAQLSGSSSLGDINGTGLILGLWGDFTRPSAAPHR